MNNYYFIHFKIYNRFIKEPKGKNTGGTNAADKKNFIKFQSNTKKRFTFSSEIDKILKVIYIGVSPSGKATDSDSVIRWFESSYPSHLRANQAKTA